MFQCNTPSGQKLRTVHKSCNGKLRKGIRSSVSKCYFHNYLFIYFGQNLILHTPPKLLNVIFVLTKLLEKKSETIY
jgi:hypothetical protein